MKKDNRIHICHLVYSFNVGGLERVIANCIEALDSKKYKHSIIALTEVGSFIDQVREGTDSYSLKKENGHSFFTHFKLYNILKKIKPDILHSYNLATIEYQWLSRIVGIKLSIHAEHGRDSYDMQGKVKKYRILRKLMSPFIDQFIAVSKDLYDWLKNEVGISDNKITLIINGVDTDYYHPDFRKSRDKDNHYKDKFIFGHVARLHPIKNQSFLISSFYKACLSLPNFRDSCLLIIVGDGPDREKLEQQVKDYKYASNNIIFVGSQSDIISYYRLFDVFVMSSLAEGIPMTLLESMSMGIPHIVSAVGGIKEVVEEGVTGMSLAELDSTLFSESMLDIFVNNEKRKAMSLNAREKVIQNYSQKQMIGNYRYLYEIRN